LIEILVPNPHRFLKDARFTDQQKFYVIKKSSQGRPLQLAGEKIVASMLYKHLNLRGLLVRIEVRTDKKGDRHALKKS